MDRTISILVETLHKGVQPYILATALKIPFSAMEAANVYDIDDEKTLPWIHSLLPLHAQGECILRVTRIFEVVRVPEVVGAQRGVVSERVPVANTMDQRNDSAPTVDMRRQLGDNEPASPAKEGGQ